MEQAKLKTSDTAAKHILTYAGVWFAVLAWGCLCLCGLFHAEQTLDAACLASGDDWWNNDERGGWLNTPLIA